MQEAPHGQERSTMMAVRARPTTWAMQINTHLRRVTSHLLELCLGAQVHCAPNIQNKVYLGVPA